MGKYKVSTDTYFIANPQGLIKIGRSCHVRNRLYELQCQLGEQLTLLAAMPIESEYRLHKRFAHLKIEREFNGHNSREWFRPGEELLAYIEDLKCSPATSEELKRTDQQLRGLLRYGEYYCDSCNNKIPWFYLTYPHFQERYEKFYKRGYIVCLSCYHKITIRTILADRIVRASLQRQPNFRAITGLLYELHTPAPAGAMKGANNE